MAEAENDTLSYEPETGQTAMKDPTPIKNAPLKLRTQIVELAKRLAFLESKLFARIFRLDEQIGRVRAFLKRNDIAPEAKQSAQDIFSDIAADEPDLG